MANFADAIEPVQDLGGAISYLTRWLPEDAGQTFVYGTPVEVHSTNGAVMVWDGTTLAAAIAGFAAENASNLGSAGSGLPVGFSPVLGPGSVVGNYAANPNQPLAVITPSMVPMSDGGIRFFVASPGTVFIGKLGTSATVTPVATANTLAGATYGVTKDTGNSFWYVDTNKTGASSAVTILGLDPREPVGTVGGHVLFQVLPAAAQITI